MSSFTWRLSTLMDQHQLKQTSKLRPLLEARGVELSREQVFRLVKQAPERLSMATLVALCDIFKCTPSDLIEIRPGPPAMPECKKKNQPTKIAVKRVKLR